MSPNGFMFGLLGDVIAVFVDIDTGTTNGTPRMATMGRIAVPFRFDIGKGFTADIAGLIILTFFKVVSWKGTGFGYFYTIGIDKYSIQGVSPGIPLIL